LGTINTIEGIKKDTNFLVSFCVDNSIEISNNYISRKEFINTNNLISFTIEE